MKRRDLIRHLEHHGCQFLREGGNHSVYVNRRVAENVGDPATSGDRRFPCAKDLQGFGYPEAMKTGPRRELARQPVGEKTREAGELIRHRQNIQADASKVSGETALLASLAKAAELDAGKGIPIERVRKHIPEWTK